MIQHPVDLLPHRLKVGAEGEVLLRTQAQRQGVNEGTAHAAGFREQSARGGGAHRQVLLPRQPGEEQAEGAQEEHVGGDALGGAEGVAGVGQGPAQRETADVPTEVGGAGAGEVPGQLQRLRQGSEPTGPVLQLVPTLGLGQVPGVVQVGEALGGQILPPVALVQAGEQHRGGETVSDDVVDVQKQDPGALLLLPQARPHQGRPGQVKGSQQGLGGLLQGGTGAGGEGEVHLIPYPGKDPVLLRNKGGAQQGLLGDDGPEGRFQPGKVGGRGQAEGPGHVVGAAGGVQVGLDIDALLNGRKGPALLRRSGTKMLGETEGLRPILPQQSGQTPGGAAGVEVGNAQGAPGGLGQLAEGLHGVEGVASEEEVVAVHPQVGAAKHPAQDGQHLLLGGGLR